MRNKLNAEHDMRVAPSKQSMGYEMLVASEWQQF
jgi:hypothetical protein